MSGFIMTLDSDDEAPRSPSPNPQPLASTSSAAADQSRTSSAKAKQAKLTKKQRQKATKVAILGDDADSDSKRGGAGSRQDQDDAAMASGFVFDGLGGGFVGRDRHSVWVRRRLLLSSIHTPWLTPPALWNTARTRARRTFRTVRTLWWVLHSLPFALSLRGALTLLLHSPE